MLFGSLRPPRSLGKHLSLDPIDGDVSSDISPPNSPRFIAASRRKSAASTQGKGGPGVVTKAKMGELVLDRGIPHPGGCGAEDHAFPTKKEEIEHLESLLKNARQSIP